MTIATSPQICQRCAEEIAKANTLDDQPGVDRLHHTVNGVSFGRITWEMFSLMLLRRGAPVRREQFVDFVYDGQLRSDHTLRNQIYQIRKKLTGSRFKIVTTAGGFELIRDN